MGWLVTVRFHFFWTGLVSSFIQKADEGLAYEQKEGGRRNNSNNNSKKKMQKVQTSHMGAPEVFGYFKTQ